MLYLSCYLAKVIYKFVLHVDSDVNTIRIGADSLKQATHTAHTRTHAHHRRTQKNEE